MHFLSNLSVTSQHRRHSVPNTSLQKSSLSTLDPLNLTMPLVSSHLICEFCPQPHIIFGEQHLLHLDISTEIYNLASSAYKFILN